MRIRRRWIGDTDCPASKTVEGVEQVYLPGEIEWRKREEWIENGIPLHKVHLQSLAEIAGRLGVDVFGSSEGNTGKRESEKPGKRGGRRIGRSSEPFKKRDFVEISSQDCMGGRDQEIASTEQRAERRSAFPTQNRDSRHSEKIPIGFAIRSRDLLQSWVSLGSTLPMRLLPEGAHRRTFQFLAVAMMRDFGQRSQ